MPPFMLMANRGECTFVTKARNAQMAGAAAVVIADDKCLCSDQECTKNNTVPCEQMEPAVADDGSGGDISIPTVLLNKGDADRIKNQLKKNIPVLLDLSWHPPVHTEYLDYSIWMSPIDDYGKSILNTFKPIALALGIQARFYPHFMIHNGSLSNCENNEGEQFCYNVCTNGGRYCYPSHYIAGSHVVTESLRRLCIWKHHGQNVTEDGAVWWEYVTYFNEHCSTSNQTFADDKCIEDAYKHAGANANDIEGCMMDSGDVREDTPNTLLDQELQAKVEYGVHITPLVWVNHKTLHWPSPSARSMLEAVCSGFVQEGKPQVCDECLSSPDPVVCASAVKPSDHKGMQPSKKYHPIRPFLFFVAIICAAFGVWYFKKRREEDPHYGLNYSLLGGNS